MKKRTKKVMSMLLVVTLVAVIAVGGMLAYLTSEDSDVNVMTLGNVQIEQIEQERVDTSKLPTESKNLREFRQTKPLYPAVFEGSSISWNQASQANEAWKVVESNANVLDKFVTVKNTGASDAYVRTLIAYEGNEEYGPNGAYIHVVHNGSNVGDQIKVNFVDYINVYGVDYTVYEYVYLNPLAPGETSIPSLKQVYMNKAVDNDVVAYYGNSYDILVLSQAVQTAGFEKTAFGATYCAEEVATAAEIALDTAFPKGENNTNVQKWFMGIALVNVTTAAELQQAISENKNIVLENDIIVDKNTEMMYPDSSGGHFYLYHNDITIDLNGHKIEVSEDALKEGKSYANGVFIVRYSTLNILDSVGTGEIASYNKAIPVYGWAHSDINIYGGNFKSNASERNESLVYVNNPTVMINVYGGNYLTADNAYAFNAHDSNCKETPVITLHEGIEYKKFLKNVTDLTENDINNGRIVFAEGCVLEEYTENGATYYKVVKK